MRSYITSIICFILFILYTPYILFFICIALVTRILHKDQDIILFGFCACYQQNVTHQRLYNKTKDNTQIQAGMGLKRNNGENIDQYIK